MLHTQRCLKEILHQIFIDPAEHATINAFHVAACMIESSHVKTFQCLACAGHRNSTWRWSQLSQENFEEKLVLRPVYFNRASDIALQFTANTSYCSRHVFTPFCSCLFVCWSEVHVYVIYSKVFFKFK